MVKSSVSGESDILSVETLARESRWPYEEYYIGNTDEENRRNGHGENHWTGAESMEWHTGRYFRDTMHGYGNYRWRFKDREGISATYEGRFYANQLHGYGVMSYADGRVFTGLFYKDVRWGPGEERLTNLRSNVGLWRGTQLARLAWRPSAPCVVPDLTTGPNGALYLDPYRNVFRKDVRIIGQANSAMELLKQFGVEPKQAAEKWKKLYSVHCTDMASALCHKNVFENDYYKGKVQTLVEDTATDRNNLNQDSDEEDNNTTNYFAWNNSDTTIHMMKHAYQHDKQRQTTRLNLTKVLSGPRNNFRPAAKHEYDCRILLMASYLGHINSVALLINVEDVYPDVADMQGNTAIMYATCGDQSDIIDFLVDAGANVNYYNDSCCTPLGVALMRYLCVAKNIPFNSMISALLPPVTGKVDKATPQNRIVSEWNIKRELPIIESTSLYKNTSKILRSNSLKRSRSHTSGVYGANRKKISIAPPKISIRSDTEFDSDNESFKEDRRQYFNINQEYTIRVNGQSELTTVAPKIITYLFNVYDMAQDTLLEEMEDKLDKNAVKRNASKTMKGTVKSKDIMVLTNEDSSLSSLDRIKNETLSKIQGTILNLLSHGADPLMIQCPQPALLMAVKSNNPDLVRNLVACGADINEKLPQMLDYTPLDIAISEPLTNDTLEMVRVMLEIGAEVNHRLIRKELDDSNFEGEESGPTLLHVLLAKKTEFEAQEDIRNQIIKLILQYNCDPCAFYNGKSSVDIALNKNSVLAEIFINNPGTNLNAFINSHNHTILVKMFTRDYFKHTMGMDRYPILTNLLLRGADPLIECYNDSMKYGNVFAFADSVLKEITPPKPASPEDHGKNEKGKTKNNGDTKRRASKEKAPVPLPSESRRKSLAKPSESAEYTEAVDLITECARLLHIRWLQAKLIKELVDVIYRYKHRTWNMIVKEHKNANNVGLWVNTSRCIEIWDILKTTKRKRYTDFKVFRHLLCIVQYYQHRLKAKQLITPIMVAAEKNLIESDVGYLLKEYKIASKMAQEVEILKKLYVKPELESKTDKKFNVCFECSLPLDEHSTLCDMCQMVSFCNRKCMYNNVCRAVCHPCSDFLAEKYFPPSLLSSADLPI